jgi:hypothetical protein
MPWLDPGMMITRNPGRMTKAAESRIRLAFFFDESRER